ncbi:MAG: DHA2 family efflux MFS transporter permease subunit [Capnocytophaga sp.]|nr:DHA2 family efflux MFS transporter permease subunit [Capnocytophaga sp.]
MNVTFPTLMNEFAISTATVQWLTTGYLLVLALTIPVSSFLKRNFSTRKLFLSAINIFIVATLLCYFAPNFQVLLVGRLLQGMGTGIALPLMINIILERAPASQLGLCMGIASLISAMAPAVGPVMGGVIVDAYGWRVIFLCLLPLLLISFLLGFFLLKDTSAPEGKGKFNTIDYLLVAVGFTLFILATEQASAKGWTSVTVLSLLAVAVGCVALFVRRSAHSTNPLIRIGVFSTRTFVLSIGIILACQFNVLALGYLIPNYSQIVTGESATVAGFLLLPGCLVGAFLAPISGKLLDRLGAKKPILAGSVCLIVALLLFAIFGKAMTTPMFMSFYVLFTIGQGLAIGNTMTYGLATLPKDLSTDGNAVLNTLQQLAGAVGTSVAATLVASAQVGTSLAEGTATGSWHAFILLLVLAIFGFACAYAMFSRRKEESVK